MDNTGHLFNIIYGILPQHIIVDQNQLSQELLLQNRPQTYHES